MHISRVVFKISDLYHHPLRNYKRYPDVVCVKNIPFDNHGTDTSLDVYYSKNVKGPLPVLLNVHGGGFVGGGKQYRSGIASFFASHGWLVVNSNYRLPPKAVYPAPTEDTIRAMNKVAELAKEYPIDLTKFVVTGDSAGGFYAAHAVAAACNEQLRERLELPAYVGEPIRALLTFCAPFNLLKCFTQKVILDVTVDVTNCVFGTNYKSNELPEDFPHYDTANVLDHIGENFPETFVVAAENDMLCGGQIDDALAKLEEKGIPHGFYRADQKGDGHCTHLLPYKKGTKACLDAVLVFLNKIKEE